MHITQADYLEEYIDKQYKSKTAFAKKIGMSRQNINYYIAEARKNNGILPYVFSLRLKDKGIPLPDADFVGKILDTSDSITEGNIIAEPQSDYNKQQPNMMTELMYLRQRVKDLEALLAAKEELLGFYKKETPEQQVDAELGSKRRAG